MRKHISAPTLGSRFVGARTLGPWVGEPRPSGKTPFWGNPSPDVTYLPIYIPTYLPQVEELTGALNYLQTFSFEAVSAILEIRRVIPALSGELELHARGVEPDGSALTA